MALLGGRFRWYVVHKRPQPESPSRDLFGEVISTYTDKQALEDVVLVELHSGAVFRGLPINRMTRHLFE